MDTPQEVIKHEKRKGLIMLGVISLGLIVFGAGFYFGGLEINDSVTTQSGAIMAVMGGIGVLIYCWGRRKSTHQESSP